MASSSVAGQRSVAMRLRFPRRAASEAEAILPVLAALHGLAIPAVFAVSSEGSAAELHTRIPAAGENTLRQQLGIAYPGLHFEEASTRGTPPPCRLSVRFGMRLPPSVPLAAVVAPPAMRASVTGDAVNGLLAALDVVRADEFARFEVVLERPFGASQDTWAPGFLRAREARGPDARSGILGIFHPPPNPLVDEMEQRLAEAVRLKARLPQFEATVRLAVAGPTRERTIELVRALLAPIAALGEGGLNALVPVLEDGKERRSSLHPVRLSTLEVVSLWHPPTSSTGAGRGCFVRGVDLPLPLLPERGVQIGWTSAGANATPVRLPSSDLRRHAVFLGASGGGKSTSLLTLMLSLADLGEGFGVIDVKGDLTDDLLGRVSTNRRRDVVVLDPSDPDCNAGIDLFGLARRLDLDLSADFVVSAFQAQFSESWGVSFPRPMKAAVRALLEVPETSILDLPRMLRDTSFRRGILSQVQDDAVREFFVGEFEDQSRSRQLQTIGPALTRIGAALDSAFGRRLFGSEAGPDLRAVMDAGGIVACRYHGGLLGKQNASLFAGLTAAACQLAAMTRITVSEEKRRTWTLICDEAHDYATASFAETLSLGRGYGLSLIVATQFLNQMPAQVRSAMLANASTLVCFRLGEEDVRLVGRRFEPYLERSELTDLSNFIGVARTSFEGERQPPFLLHVRPPAIPFSATVAEEVRARSRGLRPTPRPRRLVPVPTNLRPLPERWADIEEYEP